jgi:group I intron endonuclease
MGYIYLIKNKINGKLYIGQTIRKDLYDRWKQHKSCKKDTVGNYLYNAYIKYGIHNFDYKLICICFDDDCNKYEEYYINKYNSMYPNGYNLKPGGNNHKLSKETKQLLKENNKDKINSNKGKKMSEEQKQKLRLASIKWHSTNKIIIEEKTKKKISESLKIFYSKNDNSKGIKVEQYNINNIYIKTFSSISEAAREVGITQMMINRASSSEEKYSKYKTAKGFFWKRVD